MIARTSPLEGKSLGAQPVIVIREIPDVPVFDLRVAPGSATHSAIAAALGVELPSSVGTVATANGSGNDGFHAVCLGPDWWLLIGSAEVENRLRSMRSSGEHHFSVVEVSGQRTIIGMEGQQAKEVLSHLWEQDLRERKFPVGFAGQGLMSKAPVIVWRTDAVSYRVIVRSSFALHVWKCLTDAAEEYSVR